MEIAKPRIIYRRGRNHFFAFDGSAVYSQECQDRDFEQKILGAVEFSNSTWQT